MVQTAKGIWEEIKAKARKEKCEKPKNSGLPIILKLKKC